MFYLTSQKLDDRIKNEIEILLSYKKMIMQVQNWKWTVTIFHII